VNLVEDFLATADSTSLPSTLSAFRPAGTVLLSSRAQTSRYATALLLDTTGRPRIVAKIARRPLHQQRLGTEFELLRILAGRKGSHEVAPRPLALVQHHYHWLLLQTAVDAPFLNRRRLARSPRRTWERVEAWLLDLPSATSTVDEAWHAEQIVDPMRRLEQALAATPEEIRHFAETQALTHELTGLSIPTPLEHGDLFRAHLALMPGGKLTAIDWELGRVEGLPGADAAIFLLDLLRPPADTLAADQVARFYAENFLAPRGLARQWLAAHLERRGVERSWVDHILLATLARRVVHIWEPVVTETSAGPAPERDDARTLLRSFWAMRLWRMTLEQMGGTG
jgi:hypothetical protein